MIYIDDLSYTQLYNLANIMKINKYNYDEWETLYDLKEYKKSFASHCNCTNLL